MAGYLNTNERISSRNQHYFEGPIVNSHFAREKFAVDLRKSKRLSYANKNRFKAIQLNPEEYSALIQICPSLGTCESPSEKLSILFQMLGYGYNERILIETLKTIQSITCEIKTSPLIRELTKEELNILLLLINSPDDQLALTSLDCIVNITYYLESASETIIKLGGINVILNKIVKINEEITKSAMWIIANMAGGTNDIRRRIVNYGVLEFFIQLLENKDFHDTTLSEYSRALRNLVSVKFTLSEESVEKLVKISKFLLEKNPRDIKLNSIIILSFIVENSDSYIKILMNNGVLEKIIKYLNSKDSKIVFLALKLVGRIFSSDDHNDTQLLLNFNIISELSAHIYDFDPRIRKEIYFCFSNLAAGTKSQRKELISSFVFIKMFNGLTDSEFSVKKEAGLVFYNLSGACESDEVLEIVSLGFFKKLSDVFKTETEVQLLLVLLRVFENFLGKGGEKALEEAENTKCINNFETLLINSKLAENVENIAKKYFFKETQEEGLRIFS